MKVLLAETGQELTTESKGYRRLISLEQVKSEIEYKGQIPVSAQIILTSRGSIYKGDQQVSGSN